MAVEEKTCRLCWEDEDDGPLVQPCACCGTAQWIHEHCLEQWRRTGSSEEAAYRCGQCMHEYRDALSLELLSARPQVERTNHGKVDTSSASTLCAALDLKARGKYAQGKLNEAEPLFREVLKVASKTYGRRHPNTLSCLGNLGALLVAKGDKGDLAAAESLYREALKGLREALGNRHHSTLISINNLGKLLLDKGKLAAAEPLLREALKMKRETLGSRHPSTLYAHVHQQPRPAVARQGQTRRR